jgi:hypothetical protein
MAAGGVGDGETGSVSLYIVGNLNKLDVLLYSIRFCLWQIERLLLQSDLRFLACLASTSAPLTSTLGYPYLRRYSDSGCRKGPKLFSGALYGDVRLREIGGRVRCVQGDLIILKEWHS